MSENLEYFYYDPYNQRTIINDITFDDKQSLVIEKLLNQKNQQVKELEEENKILKQSISKYNNNSIVPSIDNFAIATDEMRYEILCEIVERLKQYKFQLQEQPKKICDEIREKLHNEYVSFSNVNCKTIFDIVDEIQAKYEKEVGGKDE